MTRAETSPPRDPHCPTLADLERFLMNPEAAPDVAAHVEACVECQQEAQRVRANNAFLRSLLAKQDAPVPGPPVVHAPSAELRIPGCRILRALDRGGQGAVFLAWHEGTKREVALKMPQAGRAVSDRQRQRFERETELVASLHHPNIVTLYDSGATPDGRLYFTMEYIEGRPLDRYVREAREAYLRPPREFLAAVLLPLFCEVCAAVQYAHQRGIIHRDLKPSNILVDAEGRPHVLDFGVAKVLGSPFGNPAVTHTAEFVGTLAYAAPEQVEGDPSQIETRTDVYALGVVLYELLAGRLPYTIPSSVAEAVRTITTVVPPPPSAYAPECGDELDTIVLKALAKDSERRYASVDALRRDVENVLQGIPIEAKRDSTWYVLRKTVRRHRAAFLVAALAALVLPAFTVALALAYRQSARTSVELVESLSRSNIERGRLMAQARSIPLAERLLWREFLRHAADSAIGRQAYWALWELYAQQPCLVTLRAQTGEPNAACFIPDRPELAVFTSKNMCERWNLMDGQRARVTPLTGDDLRTALRCELSGDGVLAAFRSEKSVSLWDLDRGALLRTMACENLGFVPCRFSQDRRWLALIQSCGDIRLYRLPDCEATAEIHAHSGRVKGTCFAPDSATLVSVGADAMIRVWSVPDGRLVRELPAENFVSRNDLTQRLTISGDGRHLAVPKGGETYLLSYPSLGHERTLYGTVAGVSVVTEFSPDSRTLAGTGSGERRIVLWDINEGTLAHVLHGHRGVVNSIAFAPDGRTLASTSKDGTTRLWELGAPGRVAQLVHSDTIFSVAFHPNGHELLAAAADGRVWSTSINTGQPFREYSGHTSMVHHTTLSPDGMRVAAAADDGTVRVWDYDSGRLVSVVHTENHGATARWTYPLSPHPHQVSRACFDSSGRLLVCAGEDGNISIWDAATARCEGVLAAHRSRIPALEFSPDGRILASLGRDEDEIQFILWDFTTRRILHSAHAHKGGGRILAFSRDGRRVATGGDDACIRLWDVASGACLQTLEGHQQDVFALAFSPDGKLLASGERSGTVEGGQFLVHLWDVPTGRNLAKLPGHSQHVLCVAFSPDGRWLASCGSDRTALVRDLTHFDRHIAGNLDQALYEAPDILADSPRVIELRAWAHTVLARDSHEP